MEVKHRKPVYMHAWGAQNMIGTPTNSLGYIAERIYRRTCQACVCSFLVCVYGHVFSYGLILNRLLL